MINPIILVLAVTFGAARAQTGCDSKADVTFLLDSSATVGRDNFNKELNFVKDVSSNFQIAQDKVQVSAVTFGTGPTNQFYLNQYTDYARLQNAITGIQYSGGAPKTAGAIRYATGTSFSPIHGGRADAPHVVVLLTNQPSGTIDMTRLEAQTARDNGIIMYTVGIGGGTDLNELQSIASDPDIRHMYMAQNFDALNSLSGLLASKICNELPPNPNALPAPTACLQKADLVFMVDSSTSVGSTNFQKLEHFLKDVIGKLDVGPNKVQVGLVKYGSYPSIEFSLGEHTNRPEALKAVEGMTYIGGGTNDGDAILYTGNQIFSQNHGARGDVPRIAVMITDGGSANPNAAVAAANKARTEHIGMITVGIGSGINMAELNSIADKPSSENAFSVSNYDSLSSITDKLIQSMCQVKATVPPMTGNNLPTDPCQDKLTNCDQYDRKSCTDYPQWAKDNCAKHCLICTPLYTSAPPKCQDKTANCASTYRMTDCAQAGSPAQTNCPLFCGLCGTGTSSTGYYGQCSYKGKGYATGETWYDGCDYECLCEDGDTGRYKCNNRCPVYYDLPSDCTLVSQPGECCLQPVCNFHPSVNTQQSSGHGVTPNGIDVCVYKNKQYFQGQTWRDGCDYQCTCTDSKKGLFKCEDLCPTYGSIPPYCHLETKAGECCAKPTCEFSTQSGSFQGTGTISGSGVGATPIAHPPCKNAIATCSNYGKSVCYNYRGWASDNCMKYCGMCPSGMPSPGPSDRCIYGGKLFQQGETWNTSCSTLCSCENAIYGYYRCVDSCPQYNNIPSGCKTVKKAGDCCPTLECGTGYFVSSQINPNTIGNGGAITVINPPTGMNQITPTLPTGEKPFPGTGTAGFTPSKLNGCLYKGQIFVQGQAWEDGCDYSCICTNAYSGLYTCRQKCPTYPDLPRSCQLIPDDNDLCCKAPKCTPDPVTHQIPVPIPLFRPSIQSHGSVQPPSQVSSVSGNTYTVFLFGTGFTPAPPTAGPVHAGGVGHCQYKGKQYTHGQIWEDGCDFNCVCDDAFRGHYTCTEKCPHYGAIPEHCYLVKDPINPCCTIPKCNLPINYVTEVGQLQLTTPKSGEEYCVYEGKQYQQGQTWYDGCSYKCTCEDAMNNVYRCLTRCPEYENTADNCRFVPDPRDPSCCVMPQCPSATTPSNSLIPTPAPTGFFVGPGQGTGFCEYKGVQYTQGQSWQDGCDLNCVCTDSMTGLYKCSEVCQKYINIPEYCTLITDFTNPCCKKPKCDFTGVTTVATGLGTTKPTLAPTPPPPGQTPVPGSTPAPEHKYCVYKGVNYYEGQTWEDGCQYRCRCDDADRGLYTCSERCATYDNVPEGCTMVTDPRDSCCLLPSCTPKPEPTPAPGQPTPSPTPYVVPTAPAGSVTGSANVPTPKPGMTPPPINYCEYKGQQYSQGQKWDDGCLYTCECLDAGTGKYKCLEKCRQYVNLPASCRLAKDPSNPCCQVPECIGAPTPAPPTVYTQPPVPVTEPTNVCVYKGQYYTQGQTWYDGCEFVCTCEDSMQGTYRCNERCPKYDALPKECTFVPSTADPLCCKEPKCNFINNNNQSTGYLTPPTPPPGVIDGGKATPSPRPSLAPSPGSPISTPKPQPCTCIYKGNQYTQGQKWKDGCQYNCECVDSCSGHYRCTEMCSTYDDLPAGCRLVNDPYNPCCKKAYCPAAVVPTPGPPGVSTPAPTPQPKKGCTYYGIVYGQGEQWNDGCDLICACEDEMTGFYRCRDRCNKYDISEGCTLVTDPRDSCCNVPYCVQVPKTSPPPITPAPGYTFPPGKIPTPAPGYTYGPGKYPTWVPGMVPTPAPGMTFAPDLVPTPAPGRTYAPWNFPTYVPGLMKPTPAPGLTYAPGLVPTPAPGQTYAPGKNPTWIPGMVPTPAPGYTYSPYNIPTPSPGRTYAPGKFPTYVPGMVPTPAPGYTYAPNEIPTPAPGRTYAPGKYPTWVPGMVPTPAPGYTYPPYLVPTPAPGQTYAPGKFPVPTSRYPTPAVGQTFAPYVPGQKPTPAPGSTYAPNLVPTPAPGQTYAPGKFPTYIPGMVPTPAPGQTIPPWLIPAITPAPGKTYAPFQYPTWIPGFVPTPAPGVTYAPGKIPTPAPGRTYAPWNFPTYVPGMKPTPAPGQTFAPSLVPTPAPGQTYAPGKFPTFIPGLMPPTPAPGFTYSPYNIPTPAPGQTYAPGKYPTWVPGMVPTPAPGQTYAPSFIPTPAPGQTYAPGKNPTYVPGMVPTPAPGQTFAPNLVPTPAPGQTYAPGKYPTYVPGLMPPTPAPQSTYSPYNIPTPAPGQTYAPGKYPTWVPGMVPTPAPGQTYAPSFIPTPAPGRTYAPGKYPTYVPGMVPTPAPGQTYAPNLVPTPAIGQTYGLGKYPTYVPGLMPPTPQPGYTYAPGLVPTPAPGQTFAPGKYPTYVPGMVPTPAPGYTYPPYLVPTPAPGQTYAPGKFPVPTNPTPAPGQTYAPYVPGQKPTPAPGSTYAPNLIPTPAPGQTYAPGKFPTYIPGMVPTPAPGVTIPPWLVPGITPAPHSTYAPFSLPTWVPGFQPTPRPGQTYAPNLIPTPAPGKTYAPWNFPTYVPGLMPPTPAPHQTFAPNLVPTPAPGQTYAPGKFPTYVPGLMPPTPAPHSTYSPYNIPTPAPGQTYAPGKYPTWVPGMVPTPAPGQTYAPSFIPTPAPGRTYAPGKYPTYVPGMVPTYAPGKTFAPNLVPTPAPGQTYAPGKYPTYVPGLMIPTPAPGSTYPPYFVPTPAPGRTYAPGKYPTWIPGMVPTPAPGVTYAPDNLPTPAPYRTYAPGRYPTWVPGMVPTPAPGQTFAPSFVPTPAPGSTYKPGKFPTYIPGLMVPTPAPHSTYAPNLIPTPAPGQTYAPGKYPTYVPGMVPTPAPGQTYAPNLVPTPAPGQTYAPGKYPTYVPGLMPPTPQPGYTYAPGLVPTPAPGQTFAPGKYPTYVPGMVPTPAPGYTYPPYLVPTPAPGQTYAPGKFPVPTNPTPAPGQTYAPYVPGQKPTPAPGRTYAPNLVPTPAPGQTYAPGKFPTYIPGMVPTPAPGVTIPPWLVPGITPAPYSTYAPFSLPTWIPGFQPTPRPGQTYAPNLIPTPAPGKTYAPWNFPTYVPGLMPPTPAPHQTFAPNLVPTPAPFQTYAPGKFPTYVPGLMPPTPAPGRTFAPNLIPTPMPGQTFAPGRYPTYIPGLMQPTPAPGYTYAPNLVPTPSPGLTYAPGYYPTYIPGLMVPTPAPGYTYAPNMVPTPAIGQTYAPGKYPTWVPGMVPTPAPGQTYAPNMIPTPGPGITYAPGFYPVPTAQPTPNPYPVPTALPGTFQGSGVNNNVSGCVHYGVVYKAGQTWQDGCQYDCECLDDHTGRYQCKERCPLFLNIPSYCRMITDPKDQCCKIPVCNTPAPTAQPTPNPYPNPSPGASMNPNPNPPFTNSPNPNPTPNPQPTPAPQPKTPGCVMNGQKYLAGQTWYMGCDQQCVCEDGTTGFYRCFDRCAAYPTVPAGCTLVADPKDPVCCQVPQCIPEPVPGQTQPTGPPQTYTGVPGIISGSGTPPTPVPGSGITSPPRNVCVYNGKMYSQGEKWQDGCKYNCICTDGMTGKYQCTERCAAFPFVPPQCTMRRDPNDICCYLPVCDNNQTVPSLAPFPQSTISPPPVGVSTLSPPLTLPPSYCVYNGVAFRQGQTWDDGCTKKCRCDDADMNIYTCFDRCKVYNNIGQGCVMVSDPMDSCCQIPKCTYIPTPAPPLTKGPGVSTLSPPTAATPCPYPMPTAVPGTISGGPQPDPVTGAQPSNLGYCEYKGQQYSQGQSWDDGCSYVCNCLDANSGQYQCQEKCPRYVGLPSYCTMVRDPNNKCCSKPACDVCPHTPVPGVVPTPGASAQPTPAPQPKEVCIMNGKQYTQGQQWYDGCRQVCVCTDGKTGHYSCNERCASYEKKAGCTMVPDPKDPVCCEIPKCTSSTGGIYGSINGTGTPPTLKPGTLPPISGSRPPTTAKPQVCVYQGKFYTQGQKWQDGCQYECVCLDAMSGYFKCTDRCPRYPNLPSNCNMVRDPTNPCCMKPECPPTPSPGTGPTPAPTPAEFCVFEGIPLKQGQSVNKGCDKVCRCEDAMTGKIVCDERCKTYPALPSNCTLITDPADQCCQIPRCVNPITGVVTGVPGSITGSNQPNPNNPFPQGTRKGCVYHGKIYTRGQTWTDGCKYNCECLDDSTGFYRCNEICPQMPPLPSYCTLVQDPNNNCCQKPYCQPLTKTTPNPSPNPVSGAPTIEPIPTVCVYKGTNYQQSQQWYDGCDYVCRCDDASRNVYNCQQRCAAYSSVNPGCTMVRDPKDPTCCEIPSCPITPPTGPNPTPGIISATGGPGGVITGSRPTPYPGATLPPPYRSGCVYKGQLFYAGQKFDDGCDYECECISNSTGKYKCVEKCQQYGTIPTECRLIQDPNKPCCQVPYCDFVNPTPFTGGIPTPKPQVPTPKPGVVTVAPYVIPQASTPVPWINPTPAPSFQPSPTPRPTGYCVYKGVYYTQGQVWTDGCTMKCRCEDVSTGYYTCNQRCPSYGVSSCPQKTDPLDSCCLIPDCTAIPTPIPSPQPGQSTINPTMTPQPITGSFTGVVPYQPGQNIVGTLSVCIYKGYTYTQGQKWQDGCSYNCECIDASRGQYKCSDRCGRYPLLPSNCHFKQSPTDACCKVAECDTYGTVAPVTSEKCVDMNGAAHAQGSTWLDSCSVTCTCTDARVNTYTCTDRCPVFSGLPSMCTLIRDPDDICCMKPQCQLPGGGTLIPIIGNGISGSATPPNTLNVVPLGTHEVYSGYGKPQPGSIYETRHVCVYKGSVYNDGQSWDDACNYVCTCVDGATGLYKCTSKCPNYPTLPSYCNSVNVPGQCCPSISCDIPGYGTYNPVPQLVPTPKPKATPAPGVSTPNPYYIQPVTGTGGGSGHYPGSGYYLPNATNPQVIGSIRDKCMYKNQLYNQGESWTDGCDYKCQCQDSRTGYYVCQPLCPVYNNLPSNQCYLQKANGECCAQPLCYDPTTGIMVNPLTSSSVFPVVGTYQQGFSGFRPVGPGQTLVQGSRDSCVYKGTIYRKGQKWDDGCDFTCTCTDEKTGMYSCVQKCPTFTKIPPLCKLESQPNTCCKRVVCQSTAPSSQTIPPNLTSQIPSTQAPIRDPNCYDKLDNCADYHLDSNACSTTYKRWAERNCNMSCGFCTPIYTPPPLVCEDKLQECKDYGYQACSGVYQPWAKDNCRKFCGLCSSTSGTTVSQTGSTCTDALDNCAQLGQLFCSGQYLQFAKDNCQKYCNLCPGSPGAATTPIPSTTTQSLPWLLMLKGVAGAPGPDLFQLWSGTDTHNEFTPLANHLTTEFNGHYKPDYSNYWTDYCVDRVKVSIYKNNVEKANIVFNATGTDKNGWFTADRIISSTYSDIMTAQKELVSLKGDSQTGREFYLSGHIDQNDKCDSFGWMFVSTQSNVCFLEQGEAKPQFYYAPGQTQFHYAVNNPVKGDVFAIQAHPNCMPSGQHTSSAPATVAPVCDYKGKQYSQGQSWADGCQYNCSCEDAALGYYRCRNLCPQYTNLPPGCTLVTKPGECCAAPECPGTTKYPPTIFTFGPNTFCYFNGKGYAQGQTWNDGCRQSCTCTDAATGFYSCRAICLNWNMLPSSCHMEPAPPGLCCQQPRCPAQIVLQIPSAYKDQYPGYTNYV